MTTIPRFGRSIRHGLLALCVSLLTLAVAGGANAQEVRVIGLKGGEILFLRTGPSNQDKSVTVLSQGSKVRKLGCRQVNNATWCRVEKMSGKHERGWVQGRYLPGTAAAAARPPENNATRPGIGKTRTVQVRFPSGRSSTEIRDILDPGASIRFVLNARNRQDLAVRISGKGLTYQIFNPDGSRLLDQIPVSRNYRGQLWQSGNHVIEVINRTNRTTAFQAFFSIR